MYNSYLGWIHPQAMPENRFCGCLSAPAPWPLAVTAEGEHQSQAVPQAWLAGC